MEVFPVEVCGRTGICWNVRLRKRQSNATNPFRLLVRITKACSLQGLAGLPEAFR
jgi:hypothetical protein